MKMYVHDLLNSLNLLLSCDFWCIFPTQEVGDIRVYVLTVLREKHEQYRKHGCSLSLTDFM